MINTAFGNAASIDAAFSLFERQPVDEDRLLKGAASPVSSFRRTLAREVRVKGAGTFRKGTVSEIVFAPSERPGWWIRRTDQPEQLDTLVDIANLWTSSHNLVLRSGSEHNYLRMVEHIIALKAGLGVDDVLIKIGSGDPPLFDESSLPLVEAFESAGIVEKPGERATYVTVREPVQFGSGSRKFLRFYPAEPGDNLLHVDCAIRWDTVIGEQRVRFDATPETFKYASVARTNATRKQYILAKTVGKLFAATRNWGYTDKNILIHGRRYYTEPRLKVGEKYLEPVWHRATLDLMAALSLTGADRFVGRVESFRAGHRLDCDAVRALYRNNLLRRF